MLGRSGGGPGGPDAGATELVGYVFMFAIGSAALVFAMSVLTDAQSRGNDLAAAKQADQFGQVTAGLVQQVARVGQQAPNTSYSTSFDLPDTPGHHNLTVEITRTPDPNSNIKCGYETTLHVFSTEASVETSFSLDNLATVRILGDCLEFRGELDTSAQAGTVRYDRSAETNGKPVIVLEPTTKVT